MNIKRFLFLAVLLLGGVPVLASAAVTMTQTVEPTATATVEQQVFVKYHHLAVVLQPGDLIKLDPESTSTHPLMDRQAIYYYASDHQRYLFPNAGVFFSWYPDFATVKDISVADMASIAIGGVVTYRPGSRLIKLASDPKVYLVTRGGVLRWLTTESVAVGIFGPRWSYQIDDVPEAFISEYKIGPPIQYPTEVSLLDIVASTGNSIDANLNLTK